MRKTFLFATAMLLCVAMNAQTIVMDGDNADWANVPMLNEPGTMPVFKMVVPQTGLTLPDDAALCVMVEVSESQKETYKGFPVVYIDADKDKATTVAADAWYSPSFGPDYEMGAWDGNLGSNNAAETIHEMCVVKSNFNSIIFAGSLNAWMLFNWSKLLPNSPLDNDWKWSEDDYHPLNVKPFTFANLEGTHSASAVFSSHEALTINSTIDMKGNSADDIALWASWAVELTNPAKLAVKANITSTNAASVDLKLVDIATNKVVASFASEEITDDMTAGANVEVGTWDLSSVPAGKYMLKFTNHVEWSAMQLNSLSLSAASTGIETVAAQQNATKIMRNGQVLILRDGKTFDMLGAEVK